MYSKLFTDHSARVFTPVLRPAPRAPKEFRLMKRIVFFAFLLDMILIPALLTKLFFPWPTASAIVLDHGVVLGSATLSWMQQLENNGLVPIPTKVISRLPLTVPGQLFTLGGDNVQVFEYPDHDTATREESVFAQAYSARSRSSAWNMQRHIYVDDKLVIFYLGNQSAIVNALDFGTKLSLSLPSQLTQPTDIVMKGVY